MNYKYVMFSGAGDEPPLYAIFHGGLSHKDVHNFLVALAQTNGIDLGAVTAGTLLWNEKDKFRTYGSSLTLGVAASEKDEEKITLDFKRRGISYYASIGGDVVLFNRMVIPSRQETEDFMKLRGSAWGKVLFGLSDSGQFSVAALEIRRNDDKGELVDKNLRLKMNMILNTQY
jgi:hypothetical protein